MDTTDPAGTPTTRLAARILVLDDADRILLLRVDSRVFGRMVWITPGGGLEPGERWEECARRELWEETGLRADIGPCVWTQHFEVTSGNRQSQRFYVVRCASFEASSEHWMDDEREDLLEARWWTRAELAASAETFMPPQLLELLPAVIAGEYPEEPIDCGEKSPIP